MKGIRFYLEFRGKSKRKPVGTVVAALVINGGYWSDGKVYYEAFAALFDWPNAPLAGTGVALDYLRGRNPGSHDPPGTVCTVGSTRTGNMSPHDPKTARIHYSDDRVSKFTNDI
jgi:hypothetical protein